MMVITLIVIVDYKITDTYIKDHTNLCYTFCNVLRYIDTSTEALHCYLNEVDFIRSDFSGYCGVLLILNLTVGSGLSLVTDAFFSRLQSLNSNGTISYSKSTSTSVACLGCLILNNVPTVFKLLTVCVLYVYY